METMVNSTHPDVRRLLQLSQIRLLQASCQAVRKGAGRPLGRSVDDGDSLHWPDDRHRLDGGRGLQLGLATNLCGGGLLRLCTNKRKGCLKNDRSILGSTS